MGYKILHVDDEMEIIKLLKMYLSSEKITHYEAYDGFKALSILTEENIDLLIVDIMMPGIDGFELIRKVRKISRIPILVISARVEAYDRIFGLEIGADDYLVKPFDPHEAIARIHALLRRYYSSEELSLTEKESYLRADSLTLDLNSCLAINKDKEIPLTAIEFRVLKLLMEQPGRVFTMEQIYEHGWGESLSGYNNVRVMISKLRDKLGMERISTIRGLGYRLEVNNESS